MLIGLVGTCFLISLSPLWLVYRFSIKSFYSKAFQASPEKVALPTLLAPPLFCYCYYWLLPILSLAVSRPPKGLVSTIVAAVVAVGLVLTEDMRSLPPQP